MASNLIGGAYRRPCTFVTTRLPMSCQSWDYIDLESRVHVITLSILFKPEHTQ